MVGFPSAMSCKLPPSVKTVRRLCSPLTLSQAIDFAEHHCRNVKTIALVMTVNSSVVRRYRGRRRRPNQIERFYARNLPLSEERARNLQSFGSG